MDLRKYIEKFYKGTKQEVVNLLNEKISNNEKTFVITANPETVMVARNTEELKDSFFAEDTLVVPDGVGILKAGKVLGIEFKETITGIDLCQELFKMLDEKQKSLYLFGASKEVVEALNDVIKQQYPNIKMLGYCDGYAEDKDKEMEKIVNLKPDCLLVALGVPKQEILISKYFSKFEKGIFMGVGGSFDILSGKKKRAPNFFVKNHLEWLYRICREPSRLGRFWNNNIKFLGEVKKEKRRGVVND